jgi:hypothetical protein
MRPADRAAQRENLPGNRKGLLSFVALCHSLTTAPQQEAVEILRQRRLGFSFVRLLPKETGVRPIVNLRRRPSQHKVRA